MRGIHPGPPAHRPGGQDRHLLCLGSNRNFARNSINPHSLQRAPDMVIDAGTVVFQDGHERLRQLPQEG